MEIAKPKYDIGESIWYIYASTKWKIQKSVIISSTIFTNCSSSYVVYKVGDPSNESSQITRNIPGVDIFATQKEAAQAAKYHNIVRGDFSD